MYVKEIKIAIWDDVLSSSWFCVVNLHLGKFLNLIQLYKDFGSIVISQDQGQS